MKRFLSFSESAFLLQCVGSWCGQLESCDSSSVGSAVQEQLWASCLWSILGGNWSAHQLAVLNPRLGFICQVLFPSSTPTPHPLPPKKPENQATKKPPKPSLHARTGKSLALTGLRCSTSPVVNVFLRCMDATYLCDISGVFILKMRFQKSILGEIVIIPTLSLWLKYPNPFKE